MTRFSRLLMTILPIAIAAPPVSSMPNVPKEISASANAPASQGADKSTGRSPSVEFPSVKENDGHPFAELIQLVPKPASEEVSDELRALIEDGELVAAAGKTKRSKAKSKKRSSESSSSSSRSRSEQKSDDSDDSPSERPHASRGAGSSSPALARARQFAVQGKYGEAAKLLFPMSRNPQFQSSSAQIKYVLGLMLIEMKLNQAAAFVFYDVINQESRAGRKSKYLRQSLAKLSLAADALDSEVLLKYAIKKVSEEDFPAIHRDMLYYRLGEIKLGEKDYVEAARIFSRVRPQSIFFPKARYQQGLALALSKDLERAQGAFDDLISMSEGNGVTDTNRVSALLGKARVLYQRKNWDAAIAAYREVPRDTEQWHEALFESTWAALQSARFRTVLSNFHSLHSDFYEDFYQPESLILRSIVYVYICRYDEMAKVLGLFDRIYKPVRRELARTLKETKDPMTFYREMIKIKDGFAGFRQSRKSRFGFNIPFLVARHVLKEGDVRRGFRYISNLEDERKAILAAPGSWSRSAVGQYSLKVVERRLQSTQQFLGKIIRRHLFTIATELRDLAEQKDLAVVETLSGKRETLKKEIAGKGLVKTQIEEVTGRDYLIQNGFEYWPFTGEYWLDEIGNYHYVGVQACE